MRRLRTATHVSRGDKHQAQLEVRCADGPDNRNHCEQDQGNSLVKLVGLRRSGCLPATVGQEEESDQHDNARLT